MIITIQNESLQVSVKTMGAELTSIKGKDGTEYLWQGDPAIWDGQAPNLFPYIARMTRETYVYQGKEYPMQIHGFICREELEVSAHSQESVTFRYESNEESAQRYPFQFVYELTYTLKGSILCVESQVTNHGEESMFFGIGGHPGFCVPLEEGLQFEDYRLEFEEPAHPSRVIFSEDCFLTGTEKLYELEEGRILKLRHDLFDQDAIVLKNASRSVTICSPKGKKAVKVRYPDYPIIGFWHMPQMAAPYVCVEPWSSLPSRKDVIENIAQQSDLIRLEAGKRYSNQWTIEMIQG